ncbi:MAG: hypothetical protein EPO24_15485 [Bacteroidetes bacterium]|nr:MAG: hypothetical protein EPO24_15485 [Bacteroidota bacterium]
MPTTFNNHEHRRGSYLSLQELEAEVNDTLHGFRSIRFIPNEQRPEHARVIFSVPPSKPAHQPDESGQWQDNGGEG